MARYITTQVAFDVVNDKLEVTSHVTPEGQKWESSSYISLHSGYIETTISFTNRQALLSFVEKLQDAVSHECSCWSCKSDREKAAKAEAAE